MKGEKCDDLWCLTDLDSPLGAQGAVATDLWE